MNITHLEHAILALAIQGIAYLLTQNLWFGAALAISLFLGREHAQREFEISKPHLLKGYEALDFWRWSTDAKLDLFVPAITTLGVALCVQFI